MTSYVHMQYNYIYWVLSFSCFSRFFFLFCNLVFSKLDLDLNYMLCAYLNMSKFSQNLHKKPNTIIFLKFIHWHLNHYNWTLCAFCNLSTLKVLTLTDQTPVPSVCVRVPNSSDQDSGENSANDSPTGEKPSRFDIPPSLIVREFEVQNLKKRPKLSKFNQFTIFWSFFSSLTLYWSLIVQMHDKLT